MKWAHSSSIGQDPSLFDDEDDDDDDDGAAWELARWPSFLKFWSAVWILKNATFGRNMCQKFKGCDVDLCSMSCLAILARWNLFGHQLASRAKKFTHLDSSFSSQRRYSWQVHHYEMSLQAFWTSTIPTCPGLKATWDWVWAIPELVSWRIT